jgi:hypothetical protein
VAEETVEDIACAEAEETTPHRAIRHNTPTTAGINALFSVGMKDRPMKEALHYLLDIVVSYNHVVAGPRVSFWFKVYKCFRIFA